MGKLIEFANSISSRVPRFPNLIGKSISNCYPYNAVSSLSSSLNTTDQDGIIIPLNYHPVRHITLENGLEVMLVHAHGMNDCSASLSVGVGSFNNPESALGLAHLLEHCLFFRSVKYPEFGAFPAFVGGHEGYYNAYTASEETNYQFMVQRDAFEQALDMFAHMFIDPIFDKKHVEKEVKVVDNEHTKNMDNDQRRLCEFLSLFGGGDHPCGKMSCGNYETLYSKLIASGNDITESVIKFYKQYYTPSKMKLCIMSNDSLDQLEQLARNSFSAIKNNSTEDKFEIKPWGEPFPSRLTGRWVDLVPANRESKLIGITWKIPSMVENFQYSPEKLLEPMFHDKSSTSLLGIMKAKGWIHKLYYYFDSDVHAFAQMCIIVECTKLGAEYHMDDIVSLVFGALGLFKRLRNNFKYFAKIAINNNFGFYGPTGPVLRQTSAIATKMQFYPRKYIFTGGDLILEHSQSAISGFLDALSPCKAIVCAAYSDAESNASLLEKWYGISYSHRPLNNRLLNEGAAIEYAQASGLKIGSVFGKTISGPASLEFVSPTQVQVHPSMDPLLSVSLRNELKIALHEWIPPRRGFNITASKPSNEEKDSSSDDIEEPKPTVALVPELVLPVDNVWHIVHDSLRPPVLLSYDQNTLLWLKQSFGEKTYVTCLIKSNWFAESPLNRAIAGIYLRYVTHRLLHLNMKVYPFGDLNLSATSNGIRISIEAFPGKRSKVSVFMLMEAVLEGLVQEIEDSDPKLFSCFKHEYMQKITRKSHPLAESNHVANCLLLEPEDSFKISERCLRKVKFRDIQLCSNRLIHGSRTHILVSGNANPTVAITVRNMIERFTTRNGREKRHIRFENARNSHLLLQAGVQTYYMLPSENYNSSVDIRFQIPSAEIKYYSLAKIFARIINSSCFDYFRTEHGASYVVRVMVQKHMGLVFLQFRCLSNNKDPIQLDQMFENYLEEASSDLLPNLSEEDLAIAIEKNLESIFAVHTTSKRAQHNYWTDKVILSRTYDLLTKFDTAKTMRYITIKDIQSFFEAYISPKSAERRKLVTGIVSKRHTKENFGVDCKGTNKYYNEGNGLSEEILSNSLKDARARGSVQCVENPVEFKYSLEEFCLDPVSQNNI